MKLVLFNGSPRPGRNNSEVLGSAFLEGFKKQEENEFEIYKLNKLENLQVVNKIVSNAENIIFVFPLYNYSMPSIVKEAIEELSPLSGKLIGKKMGFIVQYGFPEAVHARALEKYLIKLCGILGSDYLGTVIKGGCNNLIDRSTKSLKKILIGAYKIGEVFGKNGIFDKKLIDKFAKPEMVGFFSKLFMHILVKLANKFYWGAELKKNKVFETSFARPYESKN